MKICRWNCRKSVTGLFPFLTICKKNRTAIRIGWIMVHYLTGSWAGMAIQPRNGRFLYGVPAYLYGRKVFGCCYFYQSIQYGVMVRLSGYLLNRWMRKNGIPFTPGSNGSRWRRGWAYKERSRNRDLLHDGIGDTIRVSLSEDPEKEIPVARKLVEHVEERKGALVLKKNKDVPFTVKTRRDSKPVANIGGNNQPVLISFRTVGQTGIEESCVPDFFLSGGSATGSIFRFIRFNCKLFLLGRTGKGLSLFSTGRIAHLITVDSSISFTIDQNWVLPRKCESNETGYFYCPFAKKKWKVLTR